MKYREEIRKVFEDFIKSKHGLIAVNDSNGKVYVNDYLLEGLISLTSKLIKESKPGSYDEEEDWCGDECIDKAIDQYEANLEERMK